MACHDMEQSLGAYQDGELDLAHSLEVESHVRDCPACAAELRRLAALGAAMRMAPYYRSPAGSAVPALSAPSAGRWPMVLLAAAAWVLAFVAIGTMSRSGRQDSDLAREVVAAHIRSLQASHLLDVPSEDRHTVKPWFNGRLNFAPEVTPPPGVELIGGRLDYVDGQNVAALVYRVRQHTINLFTWPASGPEEPAASETFQGFHVLHWVRDGMNWWAVSDLAADELRQFSVRR